MRRKWSGTPGHSGHRVVEPIVRVTAAPENQHAMRPGPGSEAIHGSSSDGLDRALSRIVAEIHDGLRHGFFEYTLTCEVIGQERRRLTLRAGKSHQFVIPKDECVRSTAYNNDSCEG